MSALSSNNKSQYIHQKIDNLKNAKIEYLSSDFKQYFLSFKIIVIGNPGVGKSCVTIKAIQNKFKEGENSTIGFDLFTYCIKLNEIPIQLQIWDTCGQEIYKSLIHNFFRNSSLAILVYAINDEASFNNLDFWLRELRNQSSPDIKLILLGNKSDLTEERQISYKQGDALSKENEFQLFIETSAKTGIMNEEIKRAINAAEKQLGFKVLDFELENIMAYCKRKLAYIRKDESYLPLLLETEIVDYFTAMAINLRGCV